MSIQFRKIMIDMTERQCSLCYFCETVWQTLARQYPSSSLPQDDDPDPTLETDPIPTDDLASLPGGMPGENISPSSISLESTASTASAVFTHRHNHSIYQSWTSIHTSDPHLNESSPIMYVHQEDRQDRQDPEDFIAMSLEDFQQDS